MVRFDVNERDVMVRFDVNERDVMVRFDGVVLEFYLKPR